ncbi:MAG TPA: hypothetical protein VD866_13425 [Urbifossiella sp.]|nr:hypothetical protein [Urbifossiella sp.]
MFTSLALAAATLAPAQPPAGSLQLNNVRLTTGELGPARKDAKLLPGDVLFIAFDIDGLTIDPDGKTAYTIGMEVTDGANKLLFKQDPREYRDTVPLRGGKMPARAFITVGIDQPAGTYTCKLTVTDPKGKATNSFTVKFEVLKGDFGLVAINPTRDMSGHIVAPAAGAVGETLWVQFVVVGFGRDAQTKQPNVELTLEFFDEKGQPTLGQPIRDAQTAGVNEKDAVFSQRVPVFMNRPGRFSVRVSALDKVTNKRAQFDLPIRIDPPQ